jgi:pimeloyl-ACP methyl ester carboxylesterase
VPEFDPITGRYLHLDTAWGRSRLYFEEAGVGRPLVCLHTAGADSRQYRELLCDAEIASRWRVIAFDLPYHGRSMPPRSWWKKEYLLTTRLYADTVMAFDYVWHPRAVDAERLQTVSGPAKVLPSPARRHLGAKACVNDHRMV